jgi:phenylpyruvate tautomerase PptA (4-oxalocrotonate tautomerase family)
MPRVKIQTNVTLTIERRRLLLSTVLDAVVTALELVPDDRTGSVHVFDEAAFCMKPPYRYFIEICLFAGRSKPLKKRLYATLVEQLKKHMGIQPETVMIMLNEQPRENWGLRGGSPADEINFDYTIEQ